MSYLITRIRLLNFHNFVDETIDLPNGGHLFLLGDNGCGKTTILDAIHYVLTAGQSMEWNAAARVAGSRREGRRAQGIVMRYNLDCGAMNPRGGVSYALLEIKGRHGAPLTVGVGLSVSAMDERVRQWGIIRECPLKDIPLIIEDEGGRRPAGRLELKERMGTARGFYRDAKAYRNELAARLFSDRENYREVCRFLAMGKAYREIASRTADYHELFKSLLPEPKTEIFERIIEALRTLDESKSALDDLERKLVYLKGLQKFVTAIAVNREAVVRYEWLYWHHKAEMAGNDIERRKQRIGRFSNELEELEKKRLEEVRQETALQTRLDDLKTRDAGGLVRQEREGRDELARKNGELARQKKSCQERRKEQLAAGKKRDRKRQRFRQAAVKLHGDLGRTALRLPFSISELLAELDAVHRADECADPVRRLDPAPFIALAEGRRDTALGEKTLLEQRRGQVEAEITEARERLQRLQKRREARPDLPGFSRCRQAMREKMLNPAPLYKGLEWRPGLDRGEMARIEEFIGIEICATLLAADHEFEAARETAALFPGVRVTCESRGMTDLPEWMRGAFDLQRSNPYALRCLASEMITESGPLVARVNGRDVLSFRSHDRRLSGAAPRLIGETSRRQALAEEIKVAEQRIATLQKEENRLARQLKSVIQAIDRLDSFRETLVRGVRFLRNQAAEVAEVEAEWDRGNEILEIRQQRRRELEHETGVLTVRLDELARLIKREGLEKLEEKIRKLSGKLTGKRADISALDTRRGEINNAIQEDEKQISEFIARQREARAAGDGCEQRLRLLLPDIADLRHYILRTRKGFQFKTIESVRKEKEVCEKAIVENRTVLKERLNDPEFGATFRFTYEEESNELYDFRSRRLSEIIDWQGAEIAEQKEVINDQTKELFRKIIMTELVNYLRTHVSDLDRMMRRIRNLLGRRSFGGQQYRFKIKPLKKYRRLVAVIKKFSPFDPAAEEELKHFFEDHREEIVNTEVGAIPEELDYRNWYRYEMEVVTVGDQGVVMDRRTKSMGSGGEQAVPNYLLVLTIAHFLYHGKKVRLHTLLFDEAFYGIDAGRRDQILGFATDLGLQLFVASPDQDGVRREISYSTTILIKKDRRFDVHLYPYHWENPDNIKQTGLFEQPVEPGPVAFDDEL